MKSRGSSRFSSCEMQFSCVDHRYLPCALCVVLPLMPMSRHVHDQGTCTSSCVLNCSVPMSANVSKTVKHSDEWKHSQHVPKQVSALLKLRELGVFLRLRMCFTFMVPLCPADKAEKGDNKASSHFFIFWYQ